MSVEESLLLRKPPQNLDAEQSILGAILLENTSIDKALELVMPDDFYKESHRKIFLAMIDLTDHGEAIDLITLPEVLRRKEELEKAGGLSYISSLLSSVPNAANIHYHCKIIREKSILRSLINSATAIVSRGYEDTKNVDEFLDDAEKMVFEIAEKKIKPSFLRHQGDHQRQLRDDRGPL